MRIQSAVSTTRARLSLSLGLLAGALLLAAGAAASAPQSPPEPTIASLGWMSGAWRMEKEGEVIEETWAPVEGDALVGMLRWTRAGHVWLYELIAVEEKDDSLVLQLRHFSEGLEVWKAEKDGPMSFALEHLSDGEVAFVDPERDFPRRIIYRRDGDRLTVRLEAAEGSEATGSEFQFERTR